MPELRASQFCLDCVEDGSGKPLWFDGFTYGDRWNGWACPQFTKEQADAFLQAFNEFAKRDGIPEGRFDEKLNAYVFPDPNAEEDSIFDESIEGGISYYAIGSHAWVWWDKSWDTEGEN